MLPADTDQKIVQLLFQNADLTYKELSKKLKLNESTVRKRVLALRRKGIIKRFLIDVDAERLGYNRCVLGVDAEPVKIIEIGKKLAALPEAVVVFNTSGDHDFHAVIWTRNREALTQILEKVSAFEGVTKISPSFMIERLK